MGRVQTYEPLLGTGYITALLLFRDIKTGPHFVGTTHSISGATQIGQSEAFRTHAVASFDQGNFHRMSGTIPKGPRTQIIGF